MCSCHKETILPTEYTHYLSPFFTRVSFIQLEDQLPINSLITMCSVCYQQAQCTTTWELVQCLGYQWHFGNDADWDEKRAVQCVSAFQPIESYVDLSQSTVKWVLSQWLTAKDDVSPCCRLSLRYHISRLNCLKADSRIDKSKRALHSVCRQLCLPHWLFPPSLPPPFLRLYDLNFLTADH